MALDDLSVDIVVSSLKESVFTAGLKAKGVNFIELSGSQRKVFKNRRLFAALLKEKNYDAVHFNLFQGLSLNYVSLAKRAGVATRIVHSHNTALRKSSLRAAKLALHRAGSALWKNCATHRWACSGAASEFLFGKGEFTFIPNGIDIKRFAFDERTRLSVRAELCAEKKFIAGSVGRLCEQKNQSFSLDVFSHLAKIKPDSLLLLVGEGEDRAMLEAKAKQLNIEDKVVFLGVRSDVERLYSAMDAFLFPSIFEGLGIVAVEAQTSGLEVLCSENVPEEAIVTDYARSMRLSDGAQRWAKALAQMSLNKKDRSKASQTVALAGFESTAVAKMIENAYLGI